MANGTEKSLSLRDELASEMRLRIPTITQTKSFGSSGESDILFGAGTTDSDSVFVRISAVSTIAKDVLGLTQTVFTPHLAAVVLEAGSTGATWATRVAILGKLIASGVRVELYERTHTNAPAAAGISAGNLKAVFEIHPQYPLMSSI